VVVPEIMTAFHQVNEEQKLIDVLSFPGLLSKRIGK